MRPLLVSRLLLFARELQRVATFEALLRCSHVELAAAIGVERSGLIVAQSTSSWLLFDDEGTAPVVRDGDSWRIVLGDSVATDARREEIMRRVSSLIVRGGKTVHVPLRAGVLDLGTLAVVTETLTTAQTDYLIESASQISAAAERIRRDSSLRKGTEELERAEHALSLSERRFKGFFESGIIGIVLSDALGNIKEMNDALLKITGYTREDFVAGIVNGRTLNTPQRNITDAEAIDELRRTGVAHAWEKELLHKDGHRVPVLAGIVSLEDSVRESVAFILDLTERKRAEAALHESEAWRAAVMEAALDAIVLMDHEGEIMDFNPAAERTFGFSRAEAVGKKLSDLLIPEHLRESHTTGLARYLATDEAHVLGKRIEVPALRKDGTEFPAEIAVVRIRKEGAPIFTGYIRDITERRRAAEADALRTAKEAAEEANAELESFSYSIAHDLRTPLRAINGFSTALLEDLGPRLQPEERAHLDRVVQGAERMGNLIDSLLSLARLTRLEIRRDPIDVTKMAREIVGALRATDPARKVDVTIRDGLTTDADAQLLHAVLENLLGNAWKFTGRKSNAHIELGREPGERTPIYFVRDDGAGFDMSLAPKLFTPFRRLHTAAEFEGTGVGLATVARIVRRHGGKIWARSAVNQGATFRFTLAPE